VEVIILVVDLDFPVLLQNFEEFSLLIVFWKFREIKLRHAPLLTLNYFRWLLKEGDLLVRVLAPRGQARRSL
jgi:hypothetical protein